MSGISLTPFVWGNSYVSNDDTLDLPDNACIQRNYEIKSYGNVENFVYPLKSYNGFVDNGYSYNERVISFTVILQPYNGYNVHKSVAKFIDEFLYVGETKSALIFSEDTSKMYVGRIYNDVPVTYENNVAFLNVDFICEPFAYSTEYYTQSTTEGDDTIDLLIDSRVPTYPVITVTATTTGVTKPRITNDGTFEFLEYNGTIGTSFTQTVIFNNKDKTLTYLGDNRIGYFTGRGSFYPLYYYGHNTFTISAETGLDNLTVEFGWYDWFKL